MMAIARAVQLAATRTRNLQSSASLPGCRSRSGVFRRAHTQGSYGHSDIARPSNAECRDSDGTDRRRVTFTSALYTVDLVADNSEETDTFNNGTGPNNLSLSAQLADLQKLLRLSSDLSGRTASASNWNRILPLELPHPARLRYLLGVYFREMDSFFPMLDELDTEAGIFKALEDLNYSDCNLIIDVDTRHYSKLALLCSILVLGECLDPAVVGCDNPKPGWTIYQRGRKLIQHCGSSRRHDLDLIRYHTLTALYMMNSELLQSAAHAISTAVQLAMVARLNNQALWGECSPIESQSRQRLWWTIYFLDRRISQRNGMPYLIRDSEAAVDEFDAAHRGKNQPVPNRAEPISGGFSQLQTENYLQSLVDFGRLWSRIWDNFYAATAKKGGDFTEIA
jgi:hypothetical protein